MEKKDKEVRIQKKHLSFSYLLGLFETDGSFLLLFKKDSRMPIQYRVHPEVQWSQKNTQLLYALQDTLKNRGISSTLDNSPAQLRGGRAACIRICGIANVRSFLLECTLEKEKTGTQLYGKKRIDFLIMRTVFEIINEKLHNSSLGRAKIIDLKFALHKIVPKLCEIDHSLFQPRKKIGIKYSNQGLTQEDWEERHNMQKGSSLNSALSIKDAIYSSYISMIKKLIVNPPLLLPDFVSGVLEGDGCLYVYQRAASKKKGTQGPSMNILSKEKRIQSGSIFNDSVSLKNEPRIECSMNLVVDKGGEFLLFCISQYFNDMSPSFDFRGNCTYYILRRKKLLKNLYKHLLISPLLFKEKSQDRFLHYCQSIF